MSNPEVAILMLTSFIFLVLLGFPVAFTLIGMGLGFGFYYYTTQGDTVATMADILSNRIFFLFADRTFEVMDNPILVAIPLFLFMGYIVERASIVDKLFFSLYLAARNLPGSMAIAALITCAVFSTASGIVGAVVTLMGLLAFPAMANANYNRQFASGVICAGGTLGILIPPSIMLIVYSAIAELSPLRLYAAAVFPGLLLAGSYIVYVVIRVLINPSLAPKPKDEDLPPTSQIWRELLVSFVPLTVLIMLVLGSILGGLATPAEAAAMGAAGGIVLAWLYRSLTWQKLKESVFLTAKATAMVCWLFIGAWIFTSVFSLLGGEELVKEWVLSLDLEPWMFLVIAQLIIFLLGWPLEWSEILIIFIPIFLPMLPLFDVNPYFFAMLVALNLQTSFLTPPMAMSAYYLKGVLKTQIELVEIFKGLMPYLAIVIFCMVLMYQFPGIALWFPDYLFGKWIP
ncbi:MAG: TRAP transporter large permease subunit [Pseudomonadota bacterium]